MEGLALPPEGPPSPHENLGSHDSPLCPSGDLRENN